MTRHSPFADPQVRVISANAKRMPMASKVPPGKKPSRKPKKGSFEALLQYFEEFGPNPQLAEAIQAAYEESHGGPAVTARGRKKRRQSTRA